MLDKFYFKIINQQNDLDLNLVAVNYTYLFDIDAN